MKVCKACFVHVRDFKRLRGHLTQEAALIAANALVEGHVDYCNALFRGLSVLDLHKLQCVLPHDIRRAPNLSCFKSRLKTYLFQKSFPS